MAKVERNAYMSCKQPHAEDWPILVHPNFHDPAQGLAHSSSSKGELLLNYDEALRVGYLVKGVLPANCGITPRKKLYEGPGYVRSSRELRQQLYTMPDAL